MYQLHFDFLTSEVEMSNRLFEILGYEQLEDQSKLYIKIKVTKKKLRQFRR